MTKPVKLSVVRSERKREAARFLRATLHRLVREMADDHGDELTGFALVSWDAQGSCLSTVHAGNPLPSRIVPIAVHDILQQHASSALAEREVFRALWPGRKT